MLVNGIEWVNATYLTLTAHPFRDVIAAAPRTTHGPEAAFPARAPRAAPRSSARGERTQAPQPPSTFRLVPLMNPARGLARNATASATSSGLPRRPTLVNRRIASKVGPSVG